MKFRFIVFSLFVFLWPYDSYSETMEVWLNKGFETDLSWFDPDKCQDNKGKLYFEVGRLIYSINKESIKSGLVSRLNNVRKQGGHFFAEMPVSSGCQSTPLKLTRVFVKSKSKTLSDYVVVSEVAVSGSGTPRITQFIHHLGQTKACKKTRWPNLIHCVGSKDGGKVRVDFLVLAGANGKVHLPKSQIPVHARCESDDKVKLACTVREVFERSVSVASGVDIRELDPQKLQKMHGEILLLEEKLRQGDH